MTQTWLSAETVGGDSETYEGVTCLACSKQHFICLASGHVLGEDEARPSSRRVPEVLPKQIQRIHERANALSSERIAGQPAGAVLTPPLSKAS
jgi:hypothetical protein